MELRNVAGRAHVPIEFVAALPATAYDELCRRIIAKDVDIVGRE